MDIDAWDDFCNAERPELYTQAEWDDFLRLIGCGRSLSDVLESTVGPYLLPRDPSRPAYLPQIQPWLISEQPTFLPQYLPAVIPAPPHAPPNPDVEVMQLPPGGISWHNPAKGEYVHQNAAGGMTIRTVIDFMPPVTQATIPDFQPQERPNVQVQLDPRWAPLVPDWLEPWILDPAVSPTQPTIAPALVPPVVGPQPQVPGPGTIVQQPPVQGGGNWVYKKHCGAYRWVQQKRRRRRQLVTKTDIKGLAALKGVLGNGKAMEIWVATHG